MVIDFSTFYDFPREIERFFDETARGYYPGQRRALYPPLVLSEDESNVYIKAEMPGVSMDDVELTLTDKSFSIKGERKAEQGKYFRQERPTGVFQRIVTLNTPVDRDAVSASLTNGVLVVTLPKSEASKPKKISIDIS
jgi:HSP20 family protein